MIGDFELDYDPKDIGDIIQMVRIKQQGQSLETFAKRIGVSENTLELVEDGKSSHVMSVFNKLIKLGFVKNTKLTVTI